MQANSEVNTNNLNNNDEIDLSYIFKILFRNKRFISQITLLSFIGGIFYSFSLKKIWEGQFQIVLSKENSTRINATNILEGLSIQELIPSVSQDPLKTEVEILKSPLVLNKVFEYVKEKKSINKKDNINNITFNDWKKNYLQINLEKGTSILNLSYRDKNKELILPVLDKISKSYQDYSGRSRSRKIDLGINFLENQIEKYKISGARSSREAQEFALQEGLAVLKVDNFKTLSKGPQEFGLQEESGILDIESELNGEIPNQINIEEIRIESGNNIRNIDMQLKVINDNDINDPEKLINVVGFDSALIDTNLLKKLREIETEIAFKRSVYRESDITIKNLLEKRDNLIKVFKEQAISLLKARKLSEQAILKASDRPKGVLVKYRELLGTARKDQRTLYNLEINYRKLLLEKARTEDPWELITSPTLLEYPVSPNKKNIAIASLLLGILFASILSLIIEKRKGIIFSSNKLLRESKYPILTELSSNNEKIFEEELNLLLEISYLKNHKKIVFIKESKLDEPYNEKLKEIIKSQNYKIQNLDNFIKNKESNEVILMPILGKIKIDELKNSFNKLELLGIKIIGIVPIKENSFDSQGLILKDELNLFLKFLTSLNLTIKRFFFKNKNSY